jgi:Type IV secretion system pilin
LGVGINDQSGFFWLKYLYTEKVFVYRKGFFLCIIIGKSFIKLNVICCMRRSQLFIGSASAFLLTPVFAMAQGIVDGASAGGFQALLENILVFTNGVLIPFIIGIGFLVFVWGMFKYFIVGGANDDAKESGKSLMIYATLGFVLIIAFWGIVNLLSGSIGLEGETLKSVPKVKTI